MNMKHSYRLAERKDIDAVFRLIRGLADYEKMTDEVVTDAKQLEHWIFDKGDAEVLLALEDGTPVGMALFFHNFSTFLGRSGLYLEDLFVDPAYRGRGYGKGLLARLAKIAVSRGYGRFEWICLDWNQPSIDLYESLGAVPMKGWTTFRMTGEALENMARLADDEAAEM